MIHLTKVLAVGAVLGLIAGWLWRRGRTAQRRAQRDLGIMQFNEHRSALPAKFLAAARSSGKPRGLRWKQCELGPGQLFACDRVTGELYALVGATISFEAIEGGDMEDVEAVANLRSATAIFVYRQGDWTTDGRVVFNLEPPQALEHYQESLAPLQ